MCNCLRNLFDCDTLTVIVLILAILMICNGCGGHDHCC